MLAEMRGRLDPDNFPLAPAGTLKQFGVAHPPATLSPGMTQRQYTPAEFPPQFPPGLPTPEQIWTRNFKRTGDAFPRNRAWQSQHPPVPQYQGGGGPSSGGFAGMQFPFPQPNQLQTVASVAMQLGQAQASGYQQPQASGSGTGQVQRLRESNKRDRLPSPASGRTNVKREPEDDRGPRGGGMGPPPAPQTRR